ncbi:hypothetical protein ABFS82_06G180800 [Erythranthe guttata]|nr:PREDICTED: R3H domain-containing protein 1-like isoform X1 [Erythranthe guttata]|eukprot:XP_012834806.1 PREDICTED: R3H domain-containing protein 1-like isoform X1 [Erythranthe guttata]
MSSTEFSMVEELAFLVKDNLHCKYLILSVEDALVNFLQDDTSSDGMLELEPMNSYSRLLVHRLADIFGFSHQSVGEGEDRHLILERCPEASMPSILVSDFLLQSGEIQLPRTYDVLRRKEVMPGQTDKNTVSESSFEEREKNYFAARERIFSSDSSETKLVKERPKKDPVVARRMITRALGQTNKVMKNEIGLSEPEMEISTSGRHKKTTDLTSIKGRSVAEQKDIDSQENHLRKEHMGAAKRLFANALRMDRRNMNETKKTGC